MVSDSIVGLTVNQQ